MQALTPPPSKQTNQSSLEQQNVTSKSQPWNHHPPMELEALNSNSLSRKSSSRFRQPQLQRTKPVIWCAAVLCFIFSLVLIFFGIATLIVYLAFKPRNPIFDIPNASLNVVHFDSPQYLNGDFTLLANFSNPNRKIDVRFESLDIKIFFSERIISSQSIKGFTQRPREARLQSMDFITSLVFLPHDVGVKLQRQVQSNKVKFSVRGRFRVRFNFLGLIHVSHWIHSTCQIEMSGPPGVLVARQCITNR